MNNSGLNKLALFFVTLFLLNAFSNNIFGQQFTAESDAKNSQVSTAEIKFAPPNVFVSSSRPGIFPEKNSTPKTAIFPPAKKQTANPYVRPDKEARFKRYLNRTFGPYALLGSAVSAGISQITDEPEEWENNSRGYGRRLASTVGRNIISQTVIYGLDESFKLDSNYYKSGSKKIKDRFKNAVLSTFTARKPDGKRVFGFPRLAGIYTSAIVANQFWYPSRFNYKNGITSGTYSLGINVAANFLREFF